MPKTRGSSSPIAERVKKKLGMTLKGYAEQNKLNYQMLCQLACGSNGRIYGPNGIGVFGEIANQLKADGVWVEPE